MFRAAEHRQKLTWHLTGITAACWLVLLTVGGVVRLVEVGGVADHLPGLLLLLLPGPGLQPGPQAGQLRADALQRGRQVRLVSRAGGVCNKIVSPRPESPVPAK